MVYAGKIGNDEFTLGVSGRLMGVDESRVTGVDTRNLLMWDPETGSLWNQIRGEAVHGPAKGKRLELLPAVFVGLGTWKLLHPESAVLNLEPVRRKGWHFTSEDLARGAVKDMELAIGLRQGADALAVPMAKLHEAGVAHVEVDGVPLVVVWVQKEKAALVYQRRIDGRAVEVAIDQERGILREKGGDGQWDALTGKAPPRGGASLSRFPYLPTYMPAWRVYYPTSRLFGDD